MVRCLLGDEQLACLWGLLPGWAKAALILALGLFLIGSALNLGRIVKAIAGWPGVAGLVVLVVTVAGLVSTMFSKSPAVETDDIWQAPDEPPLPAPRKRRQTIFRPRK